MTEILDRGVSTKAFQHNANFLFGGELAASDTLDIPYQLLCLLSPGIGLPDIIYSLSHNPAPFHLLLYFFHGAGTTP
ncbi:MAG: hypothetical protein WC369_02720 [Dehalococcoidales bacterium]